MRRRVCFSFLIILLFFCLSCGDPGWPPKHSPDQVQAIFTGLRNSLEGKHTSLPPVEASFLILAVYDGKGGRKAFAGKDWATIQSKLKNEINTLETNKSYFTLTFAHKTSKIWLKPLAKIGLCYDKGLHGLAYSKNGKVKVLEPSFIAARDFSFDQAIKSLIAKEGTPVAGLKLSGGIHRLTCESFTEPTPGATPLPLFRANVLFDQATPEIIRQAISDGGDQLVNLQRPSGRFYYEYNPGTDKLNKKGYNLLRHAGTCYSLLSLYEDTGDEKYLEAGRRGIDWLLGRMQTPDWDKERAYPVYHKKAKLGGAGLSLMALCERVKADPEFTVSDTMHKLAAHLRKEQKPDGSFKSYYSWNKKPVKKRFSIYYPGEAMLALIRYHQLVPDSIESIDVAAKGADYLIDKRWKLAGIEVNVPPDAWLMLALHELYLVRPEKKYLDYCMRIAKIMAADQFIRFTPDADYFGGYFPMPPQVTPAGSRMEGLTAAYLLAQKANEDTSWIYETISRAATFQVRMQIRPEFDHLFLNPRMALGTFRHSPTSAKNRIDYNQHNISGLILAAKILESAK